MEILEGLVDFFGALIEAALDASLFTGGAARRSRISRYREPPPYAISQLPRRRRRWL
jgi:hypothetical protein